MLKLLQCSNPDCVNTDKYDYVKPSICPDCKQALSELFLCDKCRNRLENFSGVEHLPSGLYCPKCNDSLYDYDGTFLLKIE